jgi:hypothetical protein
MDHIELRANKIMHTELSSLSPTQTRLLISYKRSVTDLCLVICLLPQPGRGLTLTCHPPYIHIHIVNLLLLPYSKP